jgi:hypothetical protein
MTYNNKGSKIGLTFYQFCYRIKNYETEGRILNYEFDKAY